MSTAKNGDTVTIDYTVSRSDGQEVGNTNESGPQAVSYTHLTLPTNREV